MEQRYIGCKLFRSYGKALDYVQSLYHIGGYECEILDVTDAVSEWHRVKRRQAIQRETYRVDIYRKEEQ